MNNNIVAAPDRTVKILLALLVVGVWGLLLRPLVSLVPAARAQDAAALSASVAVPGSPGQGLVITAVPKDSEYVIIATPRKAYKLSVSGGNFYLSGSQKLD